MSPSVSAILLAHSILENGLPVAGWIAFGSKSPSKKSGRSAYSSGRLLVLLCLSQFTSLFSSPRLFASTTIVAAVSAAIESVWFGLSFLHGAHRRAPRSMSDTS